MGDYLDADCVFGTLISDGIFALKVWKNTLGEKPHYNVMFELSESARRAGFVVYIKESRHCIGRTALLNVAQRLNLPLRDILVRCAVN